MNDEDTKTARVAYERELLKIAITDGYWQRTGYRVTWQHIGPLMDAILESEWLSGVIREAKAEQREADARIAETRYFGGGVVGSANRWGAKQAAAAIRAGGAE